MATVNKNGVIVVDGSTRLIPCPDDKSLYKTDKLFFSSVKEEEWLNTLASNGYVLVKRKLSGYVFTASGVAGDYYYSVYNLPANAESEVSTAIINSRVNQGAEVLCTRANKAYFRTSTKNSDGVSGIVTDAASKRGHIKRAFLFNSGMLCFWLGLLCYNLIYWVRFDSAGATVGTNRIPLWDYTIDMTALFGDYPTTPFISLFMVLTILFIPSTVYFLDQYLYSRRFEKDIARRCMKK